jgi:alpha,alpha-trehalase
MATQELHNVELVILDLDGVITQTAAMHAEAWKRMFDDFLLARSQRRNESFEPFRIERDYSRYVDGKPRYEGVAAFLESRDIQYPRGDPSDPPDKETICGLGNRKNQLFQQLLDAGGVTVFPDALAQIRVWRQRGIKTAVVSSSKNCQRVLAAAGLADLFDARVDGVVAEQRKLRGKPDPDMFLEAARDLDVDPSRAIVIEDAAAGVRAGSAGGFHCTIGLARDGDQETLRQHGADIIVRTLNELDVFPPTSKSSSRPC